MPGKARPSLRSKTLANVEMSNLSETDKKCIKEIFGRYSRMDAWAKRAKDSLEFYLRINGREEVVSIPKSTVENIITGLVRHISKIEHNSL